MGGARQKAFFTAPGHHFNRRLRANVGRQPGWCACSGVAILLQDGLQCAAADQQASAQVIVENLNEFSETMSQSVQAFAEVEASVMTDILLYSDHLLDKSSAMLRQEDYLANLMEHLRTMQGCDSDHAELRLRNWLLRSFRLAICPAPCTPEHRMLWECLIKKYFQPDFCLELANSRIAGALSVNVTVQDLLNLHGATAMVVDLFIAFDSPAVVSQTILLGIALLEDGNANVQQSLYEKLTQMDSTKFFDKIKVCISSFVVASDESRTCS